MKRARTRSAINFVRAWRRRAGLSQTDLAEGAHFADHSPISELETGAAGGSYEMKIAAVADALRLEVPDLFRDPDASDAWEIVKLLRDLPPEDQALAKLLLAVLKDRARGDGMADAADVPEQRQARTHEQKKRTGHAAPLPPRRRRKRG